jgi:hypothetical protein
MNIKREDIAWLAGIIEGEGSITGVSENLKKHQRKTYRVVVEMVDEDIIRRCQTIFGYGQIRKVNPRGLGKQIRYVWDVSNRSKVYSLISMIYPWLGTRRKTRAKEALLNLPPTSYPKGIKRPRCKNPTNEIG